MQKKYYGEQLVISNGLAQQWSYYVGSSEDSGYSSVSLPLSYTNTTYLCYVAARQTYWANCIPPCYQIINKTVSGWECKCTWYAGNGIRSLNVWVHTGGWLTLGY